MTNSSFTLHNGQPCQETLDILYQDDAMVAINKPAGLLVHRSPIDKHERHFALQRLRDQLSRRVYPVHRLDKPTSGVLLFALTPCHARQLAESLAAGGVQKTYLAVVRGHCRDSGDVDHALRDEDRPNAGPAKAALTRYRCLARTEIDAEIETYPRSRYPLVRLYPTTGRRHQLRRHMKHISHPIIGDAKHGRGRHNRYFAEHFQCPRLLLHAESLRFSHPASGESIFINAGLDNTFQRLLARFSWRPPLIEALDHPAD